MRYARTSSLFLLAAAAAGAIATYHECPGCLDRARENSACEWTGDVPFAIDPRSPAHRSHLIADAQLAEELAGRFADAEHGRVSGFEGHGGYIDRGRVRDECMSRLVSTIERDHAVGADAIRHARGERNPSFDLAVAILFVPWFWFGGTIVSSGVYRRFPADERLARTLAIALASIAVSFLAVQFFQMWLALWEMIRVGNDHIGATRAASFAAMNQQHPLALFTGGIIGFWLIALAGW